MSSEYRSETIHLTKNLEQLARRRPIMVPFLGLSGADDGDYVQVHKGQFVALLEAKGQRLVRLLDEGPGGAVLVLESAASMDEFLNIDDTKFVRVLSPGAWGENTLIGGPRP